MPSLVLFKYHFLFDITPIVFVCVSLRVRFNRFVPLMLVVIEKDLATYGIGIRDGHRLNRGVDANVD